MDFEKEYTCLERNCLAAKKTLNIENDFQESLQQYSNDIYRVVQCCCRGYISTVDVAPDGVRVSGKIQITLTYYNEDSVLSCADFEEEFTGNAAVDGLSQYAFATGSVSDRYTNFRVINPRRIDIHCSQCVSLNIYDRRSVSCISDCSDSKLRTKTLVIADVVGAVNTKAEFDEEFSLSTNLGNINRLVSRTAYADITETKVIKDKALIKTKVTAVLLFSAGDTDDDIQSSEFSFEISKIADIGGVDEGDVIVPNVSIGGFFAKCKTVGDDSAAVAEVYGDLVVCATVVRNREVTLVTDGYVPNRQCGCEYKKISAAADSEALFRSESREIGFDFNSDIYEVKNLALSVERTDVKDNKLRVALGAVLMCVNSEGGIASYNSEAVCEIDIESCSGAIAAVCIGGFDFTLSSPNRIETRVILGISAFVYNTQEFTLLSEINPSDEEIQNPALTVYFGKKDESLWNIAKNFSSDTALIQKENDFSGDILDCDKVILIPGV